jgi:hypothetical protein
MLHSNRIIRPFICMLIGGLLTALLIPLTTRSSWAGQQSITSVSFDAGKTWQPAGLQAQSKTVEEHFKSYWMPIPAGTISVQIRGNDWWGGKWLVRDISVWAE